MDIIGNNVFFLFLLWAVIPAIACYWMAVKKRRSTLLWLLLGIVFGYMAIIVLYFLPALKIKDYKVPHKGKFETKMNLYENLKELEELKSKNIKYLNEP
jgi:uncharacterized membrane protein